MKSNTYLLNMSISGIKNIQEDVCLHFYTKMVDYLKKALIYGHTSRISS